jgi:tRNA G37 N-methylase TrmD
VDDRPFGGGDGMVMQAEILDRALLACAGSESWSLTLSIYPPRVEAFNEHIMQEFSQHQEPNARFVVGMAGSISES